MPFLKPYTGADKGEHPDAYWALTRIELNLASEVAVVEYTAYHDQATWSEGSGPITGAVRTYIVSGADFQAKLYEHMSSTSHIGVLAEAIAAADPYFADATQVGFPEPPEA